MNQSEQVVRKPSLREQNLRLRAVEYVSKKGLEINSAESLSELLRQLPAQKRIQVGWVEYFDKLAINGYSAYHLTITYNEPQKRVLTASEITNLFDEFYKKYFLKRVVGNNYTRNKAKLHSLPITVAFMDRHEKLAKSLHVEKFGDRLHIHAMIAAVEKTAISLEEFVGDDTFKDTENKHCGLIKTTHLNRASDLCPAYAAKAWGLLEDYMIYGPPTIDLN